MNIFGVEIQGLKEQLQSKNDNTTQIEEDAYNAEYNPNLSCNEKGNTINVVNDQKEKIEDILQ